MKKIIRLLQMHETWIHIAVIVFFVFLFLVLLSLCDVVTPDTGFVKVTDMLLVPVLAGFAFAIGFSLTIRRTNAIEEENKNRKEELEQKEQQLEHSKQQLDEFLHSQRINRYKMIIKSLNEGGIIAIDAIDDFVNEAKEIKDRFHNQPQSLYPQLQKIVNVLCAHIKESSMHERLPIHEIDLKWNGRNNNIQTSLERQRIIDVLFPLDVNKKEKYKLKCLYEETTVFHEYNKWLKKDLSSCNLQGIDFTFRILENTNFGGSAMHNTQLYEAQFNNCHFWGTYLQGCNISCSEFTKCNFSDAHLFWANMCKGKYLECNFSKADLGATLLTGTVFDGKCDFSNVVLDGADIYIKNESHIFSDPSKLKIKSANYAFINTSDIGSYLIDNSKELSEREPKLNRMQRYIVYLSLLKNGMHEVNSSLKADCIKANKESLNLLCDQALKYAVLDESTCLTIENYNKWTNKIKNLLE